MFGNRCLRFLVLYAALANFATAYGTPVIDSTTPVDQAIGSSRSASIRVRFGTPMDTTSILPSNLVVTSSLRGTIPGTLLWSTPQNELTFDPGRNFLCGERVGVSLASGIEDATGSPLSNGYHFEFATWTASMPGGQFVTAPSSWSIGGTALNLTVADLNGDDLPEAIYSNSVPDSLTILTPNGSGGFTNYARLPTAILPRHVVAADLDNNGWPDLIVCASGPNLVHVFFNNGTNSFAPAVDTPTGATPYGAYAGDLDADGDLDVATANFNGHTVSILRNTGGGALATAVNYGAGPGANSPRWIDGGDFDSDGDIDLVCCNGYSDDCSIFLNAGNGTFVVQSPRPIVGDNPNFLESRDYDRDGIVDVVTVNAQDGTLSFLRGNGNGTFQTAVTSPVGGTLPYGIQGADMDGDHDLDVVIPVRGLNGWRVMFNDGFGSFSQGPLHFGGVHCHTVGVADWNLDGDLDVVSGFAVSKTMFLYEQALAPSIIGTQPSANASGVPLADSITMSFNTNLAASTVDPSAFSIAGRQSGPHASTVAWDSVLKSATLSPQTPFLPGEFVTVTATNDLAAAEGIPFTGYSFEFLTQSETAGGAFATTSVGLPGDDPVQIEACDFDQDGDSDLAVANFASNDVSVILFGPGGSPSAMSLWSVGQGPADLWAGDVNGDTRPDLVVANTLQSSISVLENLGAGLFALAVPKDVPGSPLGLTGGDFDRDGDQDLVVVVADPNGVSVLWNNGTGAFSASSLIPVSGTPLDVASADFDRNGTFDIAVTDASNDVIHVYSFVSGPGFTAIGTFATGSNPVSVFPWDTNGDGWVDLVTANFEGDGVTLLENVGGTNFVTSASLPTYDQPRSIWGADLDGDASLDLVTANSGSASLSVFFNEGGGVYGAPVVLPVQSTPYSTLCGDWNGDGTVDIAALNRAAASLSILLNQTSTGLPEGADLGVRLETGIVSISPNPFREGAQIRFQLARGGSARVRVLDLQGRLVTTLVDGARTSGEYATRWFGTDDAGERVAAGVYFLQLNAEGKSMTQKMFHVR